MIRNFKNLEIWKKGRLLVSKTYKLLTDFPPSEKYALVSQTKRSCISIPSNIAEGCGRNSVKELNHFINIAIASSCELETQFYLAHDLGFVELNLMEEMNSNVIQLRKMMIAYQKSLEKY